MAIYKPLLLSAGGGIVSTKQQATQEPGIASVLIGLGGTGVDCIRTIKTQVYSRLIPDNPGETIPRYRRIRFLGVDTDKKKLVSANDATGAASSEDKLMSLDSDECFDISNSSILEILTSENTRRIRDDLHWFRSRSIPVPDFSDAGAGGVRQVGRFMMMDKSTEFMSVVEGLIKDARTGIGDGPTYVHIFTGLSGGTGSGIFLDVCYILRRVARDYPKVHIFGYFFMPDVNLERIPNDKPDTRKYVPRNAYAALQELDYCMNLPDNGGSFTQEYKDRELIAWDMPPVEFAHLVCATDAAGKTIPHAYNYAISATSEYVMDFLTEGTDDFGLISQFDNFRTAVQTRSSSKNLGVSLDYCAIGASCASLPLRQINTYFASAIFNKLSSVADTERVPDQSDVEMLASQALVLPNYPGEDLYGSLLWELRKDIPDGFGPTGLDWRDQFTGNYDPTKFSQPFSDKFSHAQANKLGTLQKNAKSMLAQGNTGSLIGRLNAELQGIVCDRSRGPMFAQRMLNSSKTHNLINLIDGLIEQNNDMLAYESNQSELRLEDLRRAKKNFEDRRGRGPFGMRLPGDDEKNFLELEYYCGANLDHYYLITVYQQLDQVLKGLRAQVINEDIVYYQKLARIVGNLIETFRQNAKVLEGGGGIESDGFALPLVEFNEIEETIIRLAEPIDDDAICKRFMEYLMGHADAWIQEDDQEIARIVNDFFVTADADFRAFTSRTITQFLQDKYGTSVHSDLVNYIYRDWIVPLRNNAKPLFYFDSTIWGEVKTERLAFISVPETSQAIKDAATKGGSTGGTSYGMKMSALSDRIYVMCSAAGFPLCAYRKCKDYANGYYGDNMPGRHYYEGVEDADMPLDDWRRLAPLTPQQLLDKKSLSETAVREVEDARRLFDEMQQRGMISVRNELFVVDESEVQEKLDAIQAIMVSIENLNSLDEHVVDKFEGEIESIGHVALKMSQYKLPTEGLEGKRLDIAKDRFVSFPALHRPMRESIARLEELDRATIRARDALKKKMDELNDKVRREQEEQIRRVSAEMDRHAFCQALFAGVITFKGIKIVYDESEFDPYGEGPVVLSAMGVDYPYSSVPLYQAFLSYQGWSQDRKDAVAKHVEEVMGADDLREGPAFDAAERLKRLLSVENVKSWRDVARISFPDQQEAIMAFHKGMAVQFSAHCAQSGLAG